MGRMIGWAVFAVLITSLLAGANPAQARMAPSCKARSAAFTAKACDTRPNVMVIMTDDMAQADLAHMPNVKKLLMKQGTTFADAVDTFPLCCPGRATFITGQYAHNHGVGGNFFPYGWYGMKDRGNILPRWLQKAGYTTGAFGKWLNGYGAIDAHGEVPKGFDMWGGLLDVSAYDYYNFIMNRDGKLKSWGDAEFAKKLVQFGNIQVVPTPPGETRGIVRVLAQLTKIMGPAPYHYWGTADPKNYSPDVTGNIFNGVVAAQRTNKKPFFLWWSPAAPHREDVAVTLMGRPGPDPRPAPRYAAQVSKLTLPKPPSFNEADISKKPSSLRAALPNQLSQAKIDQLNLNYQGRIGGLLAVDDHVKQLVNTLKRTGQLKNTVIIFTSDNGWLQGQHRVPGDKFLPYEESVRVPFVMRGPGIPAGRVVRGQVPNTDFAPTIVDLTKAKPGRVMDGVSLLPTARNPKKRPDTAIGLEALESELPGDFPLQNQGWARPYFGVRTDRYMYAHYTIAGDAELYDLKKDPYELNNLIDDPAYAAVKARMIALTDKLKVCKGRSCLMKP